MPKYVNRGKQQIKGKTKQCTSEIKKKKKSLVSLNVLQMRT